MIYLYLVLKLAVLHPAVVILCLMLITIITIALTLQAGMKPVKLEEGHFKTRQCRQRVVSVTARSWPGCPLSEDAPPGHLPGAGAQRAKPFAWMIPAEAPPPGPWHGP